MLFSYLCQPGSDLLYSLIYPHLGADFSGLGTSGIHNWHTCSPLE
ncbi:hypothetical protein CGRA01v4_03191 [Colletotrichum graminicola]|nr:hypothetical protein CGRA01v4_03191 [Colletotrichum graminicola]